MGKENSTQLLINGRGVWVGGESRRVKLSTVATRETRILRRIMGKENSTQHLIHGRGVWVGGESRRVKLSTVATRETRILRRYDSVSQVNSQGYVHNSVINHYK
jgi:hypothetical protein